MDKQLGNFMEEFRPRGSEIMLDSRDVANYLCIEHERVLKAIESANYERDGVKERYFRKITLEDKFGIEYSKYVMTQEGLLDLLKGVVYIDG